MQLQTQSSRVRTLDQYRSKITFVDTNHISTQITSVNFCLHLITTVNTAPEAKKKKSRLRGAGCILKRKKPIRRIGCDLIKLHQKACVEAA